MIIFLDIDGVLNDHTLQDNNYCGTKKECVSNFNKILDAFPEAKIVISSAWRYMILGGDLTLNGFEMLLLSHGVKCRKRVIGHTMSDESEVESDNYRSRAELIKSWMFANTSSNERFIVLDDMYLGLPESWLIDGKCGLTKEDAYFIIAKYIQTTPLVKDIVN